MTNWQERADSAKRMAVEAANKRDKRKEAALKGLPHTPTEEQIFRTAMEQLEGLGVRAMLGEINRDTHFWEGLGVLTSERSEWKWYLPDQTLIYNLYGEYGRVSEKWEDRYVTKFGHYEQVHLGSTFTGQGTAPDWYTQEFGFHKENVKRLVGYKYMSIGALLQVRMIFDTDHNFHISTRSTPDKWYAGISGIQNFDDYTQDGYPLAANRALSFLENALLKAIQHFDEGPTLAQLQHTAQEQNDKLIAKINGRVGQTYDLYNKKL